MLIHRDGPNQKPNIWGSMMADAKVCKIEGCGNAQRARGWCGAHYMRWRRHSNPLAGGTSGGAPLSFLAEAIAAETDKCIAWPFARDLSGYGMIHIDGKKRYASRVICAKVHGEPPSAEHEAAHSCGKGRMGCINWRHLSWKTRVENEADKLAHGTRVRGEKCNAAKLTEADVREIRRLRGSMTQDALAERFCVLRTNISRIQNRSRWAWLED